MEDSLLEALISGGVGAILAALIFIMYRRDRLSTEKMWRESKKFTEDRLTKLIEQDQESRKENTKALTELNVLLRSMNGRHK